MARTSAKVLKSRLVYSGAVFRVHQDDVLEPGGVRAVRDVVAHFGSIVLLPVLRDGRILLVRQYRHPVRQNLWELVAGRIERGESPLAAARRELLEETGYTARRYRKLLEFVPAPGYTSEVMLLYLAEGLTAGAAQPEEDERLTLRAFSLRELEARIRRHALRDGKTIAGVLYYARFARRRR